MPALRIRSTLRHALAPLALVVGACVLSLAASPADAGAAPGKHMSSERLVVRGDATIVDAPCQGPVCTMQIANGAFRGAPIGRGAYAGSIKLAVAEAFDNGEGGVCAPLEAQIVLGAGTPNRLVLAVSGDSCQDGAGPPPASSFTGLGQFVVKQATGSYAGAWGYGLATFAEDAADHDRMTLVGRIWR